MPVVPAAITNGCAAVIGNRIHVPGGGPDDQNPGRDLMQVLDTDTGTWTIEHNDPLPGGLKAHTCTALGAHVFVFGGSPNGAASTAWVYDSEALPGERWRSLPPLPFSSRYLGSATDGHDIFLAGGVGSSFTVNLVDAVRFDPDNETYSSLPNLNQGRGGVQLAVLYNRLFAVGGGWVHPLNSIESLDLDFPTEWEGGIGQVLGEARGTFTLAVAPELGTILISGGWNGERLASSERRGTGT